MNRNIIILVLILIIFIGGCTQQSIKIPESPTKLDPTRELARPADKILAEITFLSPTDGGWKVQINEIRDYIRYPGATNSMLKVNDEVSIYLDGSLDTFESRGPNCTSGYRKSPKPKNAETTTASSPPTHLIPKVAVGDKYLSSLLGCFKELNCQRIGWSAYLYNSNPIVIEHECVPVSTVSTGTPPTIQPQETLPSVEPKQSNNLQRGVPEFPISDSAKAYVTILTFDESVNKLCF